MKTHLTILVVLAATYSTASGNWSASGTWNNGVPVNDNSVAIGNHATVTVQSGDIEADGYLVEMPKGTCFFLR